MIQRIQSVLLLLTALAALLFLTGPFLTFIDNSGTQISLSVSGTVTSGNEKIGSYFVLPVFAFIIPVMAFAIIFFFRKRQLQIKLTGVLVAFEIAFLAVSALCVYLITGKNDVTIVSWIKSLIPVIQIILTVLAMRAIRRDEDLVKSYNRIR